MERNELKHGEYYLVGNNNGSWAVLKANVDGGHVGLSQNDDWRYGKSDKFIPLDLAIQAPALQAENEKLKRVAKAAQIIMNVADTKTDCPHGYNGKYPTSSWWCDDCFFELQEALASLMPGQP